MRLIPDPTPRLNPTSPAVILAIERIQLEMALIRHENPDMTPNEAHREARRRAVRFMLAALPPQSF